MNFRDYTQPIGADKFTFDFSAIPDEFDWLGQFSLIDGERTFGLLESQGTQVEQIEDFLGLDPGTLNSLTDCPPTNGAVLKVTIPSLEALEMLQFDWNFENQEWGYYDDFSFYATSDGQVGLLSSASQAGYNSSTGWNQMILNVQETDGPAFFAFGVLNVYDQGVNAFLGVDQIEMTGTSPLSVGNPLWDFDA